MPVRRSLRRCLAMALDEPGAWGYDAGTSTGINIALGVWWWIRGVPDEVDRRHASPPGHDGGESAYPRLRYSACASATGRSRFVAGRVSQRFHHS